MRIVLFIFLFLLLAVPTSSYYDWCQTNFCGYGQNVVRIFNESDWGRATGMTSWNVSNGSSTSSVINGETVTISGGTGVTITQSGDSLEVNATAAGYTNGTGLNLTGGVFSILWTYFDAWNAAYAWGNHSLAGYLTAESDPKWVANVTLVGFLAENEAITGTWTMDGSTICTAKNADCNQSFTDTNETDRMENITSFTCTGTDKVSSFASNATPICTADTDTNTNLSGSAAGGDLTGTYPSPLVKNDSHTHACQNITGATSDLCTLVDTDTNDGTGGWTNTSTVTTTSLVVNVTDLNVSRTLQMVNGVTNGSLVNNGSCINIYGPTSAWLSIC